MNNKQKMEERIYQFVMQLHAQGAGSSIEKPIKDFISQELTSLITEIVKKSFIASSYEIEMVTLEDILAIAKERGIEIK